MKKNIRKDQSELEFESADDGMELTKSYVG